MVAWKSHKKCLEKNGKTSSFPIWRGTGCKKWVFGRPLVPLIRKSGQTFRPFHMNKSALSPGLYRICLMKSEFIVSLCDENHIWKRNCYFWIRLWLPKLRRWLNNLFVINFLCPVNLKYSLEKIYIQYSPKVSPYFENLTNSTLVSQGIVVEQHNLTEAGGQWWASSSHLFC